MVGDERTDELSQYPVVLDEGWSVLKEPVEGAAVFVCKTCFEREMMEGEDSGSPMIRGEGQVSW